MPDDRISNFARLSAETLLFACLTLAFSAVDKAGPQQPRRLDSGWNAAPGAQQSGAAQAPTAGSSGASRDEASFEQFLQSHPVVRRELESNPSLVNDPAYVQNEPDLGKYLTEHPGIKSELQKNATELVRSENADATNRPDKPRANAPLNSADAQLMDRFLDQHKDVDQQLKQNPALIDDATFLAQHQDLMTLLDQHPDVRVQFEENPAYFTQRQWYSDSSGSYHNFTPANREAAGTNSANANSAPASAAPAEPAPASRARVSVAPDSRSNVNPTDVARLQQFFEDHAQIARQVESNPTLVTDHKYLDKHKDLRVFFYEHVQLREAFVEHPHYFTRRGAAEEGAGMNVNTQPTGRDLAEIEKLFRKHKDIAKELRRNPVSGMDARYLEHHKDLRRFFDEHAEIQVEFDHDPRYFMQRESEYQRQR